MSMLNTESHGSVPRPIILVRLLWRCAFCVFAVVAGNVVLSAVPQVREALRLSAHGAGLFDWRTIFYVGAVLYWALTAWFVARLLLSREFPNDSLGARPGHPFVNWVARILPRLLAFLATLPVCLLTLHINLTLGMATTIASAVFLLLLVLRARFGDVTEKNSYGAFKILGPLGRQAVLGVVSFSLVMLGGLWNLTAGRILAAAWLAAAVALWRWDLRHHTLLPDEAKQLRIVLPLNLISGTATLFLMSAAADEIGLARTLASPAILLFALGSWTVFGGFVLTYLPLSRGWLSLAPWLPLFLYAAGGLLASHETHWVAQREPPAEHATAFDQDPDWRKARGTLDERFAAWIGQHPPGEPVFTAALVGGASRAAFWSGSMLARLEDEARQQERRFAASLFAISSVSGGSLGAAAFVADLARFPDSAVCPAAEGVAATASGDCRSRRIRDFLSGDFLSPVLGRMLFPDLFLQFVPLPLPKALGASADRSLGLEEAWARDWERLFGTQDGTVSWRRPVTALYAQAESDGVPHLPTLLLNTVRLDDGQRFLQANVRVDLPGVMDLLDPALDTRRLSLAQAGQNSARFPYVSPGGMLRGNPTRTDVHDEAPRMGRLGDGGYHEASGAATLADLLEALSRKGLLRRQPGKSGLWACRDGWPAAESGAACPVAPSPVVALILESEASTFPTDYVRDLDGHPSATPVGMALGNMPLPELLGPVFGGLSTRTDLSRESQQRLSRLVGSEPWALIELRMPLWRPTLDEQRGSAACAGNRAQPSMNWSLDACSLERLWLASSHPPPFGEHPTLAERALTNNLARLRALIRNGRPDGMETKR